MEIKKSGAWTAVADFSNYLKHLKERRQKKVKEKLEKKRLAKENLEKEGGVKF